MSSFGATAAFLVRSSRTPTSRPNSRVSQFRPVRSGPSTCATPSGSASCPSPPVANAVPLSPSTVTPAGLC